MVRFFSQFFRVREEIDSNNSEKETNQESLKEANQTHERKSETNLLKLLSFRYYQTSNKPQTTDVAVGDDETPRSGFSIFFPFLFRKNQDQITVEETEDTIDKIVHSFQREALIATREIVASTGTSIISVFFTHPFDVIKSQYQLLRYPRTLHSPYFRRRKFIYVLRNFYMTKGFKRLYRNLWNSQQESILQVVSMFWTYQRVHTFCEENFDIRNEDATNFLAGFVSATIPVMVLHPYHTYRERLDITQVILERHGKTAADSAAKQCRYWRPLYRGCFAMFMHLSVQYGLRFMFFHKIRDQLAHMKTTIDKATDTNPYVTEVDSIINLSNYELLFAGAMAAILGDMLAHPLDVIRSRLDMTALMRQQYRYDETCRRFRQCAKLIWKHERFHAFYAGITPCIIRSTVSTALQFAVYEKMRDLLRPIFSA